MKQVCKQDVKNNNFTFNFIKDQKQKKQKKQEGLRECHCRQRQ